MFWCYWSFIFFQVGSYLSYHFYPIPFPLLHQPMLPSLTADDLEFSDRQWNACSYFSPLVKTSSIIWGSILDHLYSLSTCCSAAMWSENTATVSMYTENTVCKNVYLASCSGRAEIYWDLLERINPLRKSPSPATCLIPLPTFWNWTGLFITAYLACRYVPTSLFLTP